MTRKLSLSVAAALLLLLTACTKTSSHSTGPSSSPTPTSPSPTPTATCALTGSAAAKTAAAVGGVMLLTDVQAAGQPCYDRVVFTFHQKSGANGTPGYSLAYKDGPFTHDPSDKPMTIAGTAFLFLRLEPASGADLASTLPSVPITYNGPKDITPSGTTRIAEIEEAGDFEGVLTWVVGLKAVARFNVSVLRSGSDIRLVIDVG